MTIALDWRAAGALTGERCLRPARQPFSSPVLWFAGSRRFRGRGRRSSGPKTSSLGRGHYHWQHEPAGTPCARATATGTATAADHGVGNRQAAGRKQDRYRPRHAKADRVHEAADPRTIPRPGDYVYEPFSGSGTTVIAGQMTGRCALALDRRPPTSTKPRPAPAPTLPPAPVDEAVHVEVRNPPWRVGVPATGD